MMLINKGMSVLLLSESEDCEPSKLCFIIRRSDTRLLIIGKLLLWHISLRMSNGNYSSIYQLYLFDIFILCTLTV